MQLSQSLSVDSFFILHSHNAHCVAFAVMIKLLFFIDISTLEFLSIPSFFLK